MQVVGLDGSRPDRVEGFTSVSNSPDLKQSDLLPAGFFVFREAKSVLSKGLCLSERVGILRQSRQVHARWYAQQYPDVLLSGLHPAEHHLRYGAMLGRKPRAGFDTKYHFGTCPDVVRSGMNPLTYYVLYGKKQGRQTRPAQVADMSSPVARIEVVRHRLLSFALSHKAKSELVQMVRNGASPAECAAAAQELACREIRSGRRKGYEEALEHIAAARAQKPDMTRRTQLVIFGLLCHLHAVLARLPFAIAKKLDALRHRA